MSLKKIDRHFVGKVETYDNQMNYRLYFQLVNLPTGYYVQGTVYKNKMEVYAALPPTPTPKSPIAEFNDSPEFVQVTSYMKLLGEIEWDESNQIWDGELTIGRLTLMKRGNAIFGWEGYRITLDDLPESTTFATSLYGLLHVGSKPMRIHQINPSSMPATGFVLQAEPHSMREVAPYFNNSSVNIPQNNLGTYTIRYSFWTPYTETLLFLGYRKYQYEEAVQYNKRTKAIVNRTTSLTLVSGPADSKYRSVGAGNTDVQNRRRYHQIPEEEWFHTSSSATIDTSLVQFGTSNTAFRGLVELEYSGDITSAGCAVTDLSWGVEGTAGGNTFLSQLDYNWILPTPGSNSIGHPPGVTKFIRMRRWIWKDLDITHPRVKLQITTPNGSATTCWVGPTPITVAAPALSLVGDDKAPDYVGQGGTGRVPDLQVLDVTGIMTPDSGAADPIYNPLNPLISNQFHPVAGEQLISRSINDPDYMGDLDIQVVDTSKAAGWSFNISKKQAGQTDIHNTDRFTYNDWLTLPRYFWGWPSSLTVSITGLSYSQANGTWTLPLRNPSAKYNSTLVSGYTGIGSLDARYGKSLFDVPPGGVLSVFLSTLSTPVGARMVLGINGPVDPLVGRTTISLNLVGRVNFLGPVTLSVQGRPGVSVSLVPSS